MLNSVAGLISAHLNISIFFSSNLLIIVIIKVKYVLWNINSPLHSKNETLHMTNMCLYFNYVCVLFSLLKLIFIK